MLPVVVVGCSRKDDMLEVNGGVGGGSVVQVDIK